MKLWSSKPIPRLSDEDMVAALHKLGEDEQIAFLARLFDLNGGEGYRLIINQPWMQMWINCHAKVKGRPE